MGNNEDTGEMRVKISKLEPGTQDSMTKKIFGELEAKETEGKSTIRSVPGLVPYPWLIEGIYRLRDMNTVHAACLEAKVACIVGLGVLSEEERKNGVQTLGSGTAAFAKAMELAGIQKFKNEKSKVEKQLGPLTDSGFYDVLHAVVDDLEETGTAYLEIIRKDPADQKSKILGIYHVKTSDCHAVEEEDGEFHYHLGTAYGNIRVPAFGDVSRFMDKFGEGGITGVSAPSYGPITIGLDVTWAHGKCEIIRFKSPTSRSRHYGKASWLSAIQAIELREMMRIARYSVFNDRGLPDKLVVVAGKKVGPKDWDEFVEALSANKGASNNHRSAAVNIPLKDIQVDVHNFEPTKGTYDKYIEEKAALDQEVLTGHRTPALIANIQIPGKMSAANEFISHLQMFQALVVAQEQLIVEQTLWNTLFNSELNGSLELEPEDFILKKITDLVDMANASVVSQMREELPEANSEGRRPEDGLQD